MTTFSHNTELAAAARDAWERCSALRARRLRNKRYTYGDQWSDPADDGTPRTERDAMLDAGYKPLSNNLIRQLVKCIVGRWRYQRDDNGDAPRDEAFSAVYDANSLAEIDCRTLEEFLISGCAIQRVISETRPASGTATYVDMVSPDRFFVNAHSDPRGRDIEMVGMLHDMSPAEVMGRFGTDAGRRDTLLRLYGYGGDATAQLGDALGGDGGWSMASESRRLRVVEVWTLESRPVCRVRDRVRGRAAEVTPAEFRRLRALDPQLTGRRDVRVGWYGRYMAPDGTVLAEIQPLPGGTHPFAIRMYPMIDGEIHPLVEDVIDQQIYVNRLITLLDRVLSTSAKGALLFPENQLVDGMTLEEVGRAWAAPDGIIPYRAIPGYNEPKQVMTTGGDIGARELLEVQMRLFERVSGVSDALQGRVTGGVNGAQLYDTQVRNALISIADLLGTFDAFIAVRDALIRGTARAATRQSW